jgi:hypothetical protein
MDHHHEFESTALRYSAVITPTKRGWKEEAYKLRVVMRSWIADVMVADLSPLIFARYRDERLAQVGPDAVIREIGLIRHALKVGA